jgi:hypothetical protein
VVTEYRRKLIFKLKKQGYRLIALGAISALAARTVSGDDLATSATQEKLLYNSRASELFGFYRSNMWLLYLQNARDIDIKLSLLGKAEFYL